MSWDPPTYYILTVPPSADTPRAYTKRLTIPRLTACVQLHDPIPHLAYIQSSLQSTYDPIRGTNQPTTRLQLLTIPACGHILQLPPPHNYTVIIRLNSTFYNSVPPSHVQSTGTKPPTSGLATTSFTSTPFLSVGQDER